MQDLAKNRRLAPDNMVIRKSNFLFTFLSLSLSIILFFSNFYLLSLLYLHHPPHRLHNNNNFSLHTTMTTIHNSTTTTTTTPSTSTSTFHFSLIIIIMGSSIYAMSLHDSGRQVLRFQITTTPSRTTTSIISRSCIHVRSISFHRHHPKLLIREAVRNINHLINQLAIMSLKRYIHDDIGSGNAEFRRSRYAGDTTKYAYIGMF